MPAFKVGQESRYSPSYFSEATASGFTNTAYEVYMFGQTLSISVEEPVNVFDADATGPLVAAKALEAYKLAVE